VGALELQPYHADLDRAVAVDPQDVLDSANPDMRMFFARGGKLLLYHGWSDPQVTPFNTINFFNKVVAHNGSAAVGKSVQLYMVPGMNHCAGGPGTDAFDKMGAMEQWVQTGVAPDRIVASHLTAGVVDRTRPLCPFGQVARWNGSGSTNDAASFACVAEAPANPPAPTPRR
jgi:feruloyl esterase